MEMKYRLMDEAIYQFARITLVRSDKQLVAELCEAVSNELWNTVDIG